MKRTDKENWLEEMEALSAGTAIDVLGIRFTDVDAESAEAIMPITDAARQPFGLLHGGVSMVLAETVASCHANYGIDTTVTMPVGIEINGSHLQSASEGHVRAIATVLRRSRSFIFHEIKIYHVETGNLLSVARVTNYYKPMNPGSGAR
jgi:1,4-dihydroxy-2-naphthoyl-CoA hydrolase